MNLEQFAGVNAAYVLELYERYRQNPESVDPETRKAFDSWTPDAPAPASAAAAGIDTRVVVAAANLADSIRRYGHLAARVDPVEFRLRRLSNPRGIEVLRRVAARMGWQPRPSPRPLDASAAVLTGRGIAYVHYKHDETLVAMGMELALDRATVRIRVTRVVCAQDCGLMINPDSVRSQVEGNILQTLLIQRLDEPTLGAGEAASTPVPGRSPTPCSTRRACGCATFPFRRERVRAALAAARS